jgi:hypothetical protein
MVFQAEDRTRAKRQQAEAAIQMALQGRWEDAIELNRALIESFPLDVDAYNRLGKAFTELGRYAKARDAYMKAIEIDPLNAIARKNLARLESLGEEAGPPPASQKLAPEMFIEEMGKTGVTTLVRPNMQLAARMTSGDQVQLRAEDATLTVQTLHGDHLGEIEPKLGQRLLRLMAGGNQYVAAIQGLDEANVRVFIRETFQDASQTGKLSFPPAVTETFRPYVKSRLVRRDDAEDEAYFAGDEADEWESGQEPDEEEVEGYDEDAGPARIELDEEE